MFYKPLLPSLEGGEMTAIILSIWSIVEEPGNMGFPNNISPRIHPRLHMSTPSVYLLNKGWINVEWITGKYSHGVKFCHLVCLMFIQTNTKEE